MLAAGCAQRDEITRYTVKKPELVDPTLGKVSRVPTAGQPQRMLGAIFVVGDTGWFFKLVGDPAEIAPTRDKFVEVVKSFQPPKNGGKPSWTLPEGWKEVPGDGFRYATIQIDGAPSLDLSVTSLGRPDPSGDEQEYVLSNVNRWRDQVGLAPIAASELAVETETLPVGELEATLVDIEGTAKGAGMSGAPFAPFAGGAAGPPVASSEKTTSGEASPELKFQAPPEWKAGASSAFTRLAFQIGDDPDGKVTVSTAGGDLLANVNRWRGQVGLAPVDQAELDKTITKIDTLGVKGDYVELVGEQNTILGVVAPVGGEQWFVKLTAPNDLAAREKLRFEAFVKSLKLE